MEVGRPYAYTIEYVPGELVMWRGSLYRCVEPASQGESPDAAPEKWQGETSRRVTVPSEA